MLLLRTRCRRASQQAGPVPSAHAGAQGPLLTTPLYPMRNPKVVWPGPPGPVKSLLPGWQREPGNGPAEAALLPCHHHCQHWSPGQGQPDPGLYRCKMGSNTGLNGVGWGRLRQSRAWRAPRGPYSIWQQRMWGCRQGTILRGSLRERKEEGKAEKKREEEKAVP